MQILLYIALVVAVGLFVWQGALFIRDIVRKVKKKKLTADKVEDNSSVVDTDRKE